MNQKHKEALEEIKKICKDYDLDITASNEYIALRFMKSDNNKTTEVYLYEIIHGSSEVESYE